MGSTSKCMCVCGVCGVCVCVGKSSWSRTSTSEEAMSYPTGEGVGTRSPPTLGRVGFRSPPSCNINGYLGEANANCPCLTQWVKVQMGVWVSTPSAVGHGTDSCRLLVLPQEDFPAQTPST